MLRNLFVWNIASSIQKHRGENFGRRRFKKCGCTRYGINAVKYEIQILNKLASIAQPCVNLACDVEIMQSGNGFLCEYLPYMLDDMSSVDARAIDFIWDGVLHALEYCHANGIVHRDVAPQNIGLRKSPAELESSRDVVLFDFDLAEVVDEDSGMAFKCYGRAGYASYMLHSCDVQVYREINDIESLLYVRVEIEEGELPWGLPDAYGSGFFELEPTLYDQKVKKLQQIAEQKPSLAEFVNLSLAAHYSCNR